LSRSIGWNTNEALEDILAGAETPGSLEGSRWSLDLPFYKHLLLLIR
jgi:hypothetical protein